VRVAIEGLSVDAEVRALESVREHVACLVSETALDRELAQAGEMPARVREIREEARLEAARRELDEIKRSLAPRVLVPPTPPPRPASAAS
jgi:phage shock protein A